MFKVEVTDTFGGEANYSWVNRFEVDYLKTNSTLAIVRAAVGDEQIVERTTTTQRWIRVYDEATQRYAYELKTETTHAVEKRTVRDWRAALAWLERTQPETYARVTKQWVSGPGEEPLEVRTVDDLRDKLIRDLDQMEAELADANERETHLRAVPVLETPQTEDT
jgi:hypothetical protein